MARPIRPALTVSGWSISPSADPVTPGTPIQASFDPGNQTNVYSFEGHAGDKYFFDTLTGFDGRWRLIDPAGTQIFSDFYRDQDVKTLALDGTYKLLLEGPALPDGCPEFSVQHRAGAEHDDGHGAQSGRQWHYRRVGADQHLYFFGHNAGTVSPRRLFRLLRDELDDCGAKCHAIHQHLLQQ